MEFAIEKVRGLFPSLQRAQGDGHSGRPVIYLDNPAGTQVPARQARPVSQTEPSRQAWPR